jgi:hypothetical protein
MIYELGCVCIFCRFQPLLANWSARWKDIVIVDGRSYIDLCYAAPEPERMV